MKISALLLKVNKPETVCYCLFVVSLFICNISEYIDRHNGPDSSIHIEGLLEQIQQNGDIVRRCHPDQYGILAKRGLIQNIFESLTSRQSGDSA